MLQPEYKSRFEEFDILMRESIYKSEANEQLGKERKGFAKPIEITNINTTFGIPSRSGAFLIKLIQIGIYNKI